MTKPAAPKTYTDNDDGQWREGPNPGLLHLTRQNGQPVDDPIGSRRDHVEHQWGPLVETPPEHRLSPPIETEDEETTQP